MFQHVRRPMSFPRVMVNTVIAWLVLFAVSPAVAQTRSQATEDEACQRLAANPDEATLKAYSERYGRRGICISMVLNRLDDLMCSRLENNPSAAALSDYLRTFPRRGQCKSRVEKQLSELARGGEDARQCKNLGANATKDAIGKYLAEFPNGQCAAEMKARLAKPDGPVMAALVVRSNVSGDMVFIDGLRKRPTSAKAFRLAPGKRYKIRVEKPGHTPWEKSIRLDSDVTLNAVLRPLEKQPPAQNAERSECAQLERAGADATTSALTRYLDRYPAGLCAPTVRDELARRAPPPVTPVAPGTNQDRLSCARLRSAASPSRSELEAYLKAHPQGSCQAWAAEQLSYVQLLDEDKNACQTLRDRGLEITVTQLESYLRRFPGGACEVWAQNEKVQIAFRRKQTEQDDIECTRLRRIKPSPTRAQLDAYLLSFPNGRCRRWATGRIGALETVDETRELCRSVRTRVPSSCKAAGPSGCVAGDCLEGSGIVRYDDGRCYFGGFRSGVKSGKGGWYIPKPNRSSDVYYGDVERAKVMSGTFSLASGNCFIGERHQDGEYKKGVFLWKDGGIRRIPRQQ